MIVPWSWLGITHLLEESCEHLSMRLDLTPSHRVEQEVGCGSGFLPWVPVMGTDLPPQNKKGTGEKQQADKIGPDSVLYDPTTPSLHTPRASLLQE